MRNEQRGRKDKGNGQSRLEGGKYYWIRKKHGRR